MLNTNLNRIELIAFALLACVASGPVRGQAPKFLDWSPTPPMGWNSWDCFGAGVTEKETLANADYMNQHLKSHGWNIITVDIQWYEPLAHTDGYRTGAILEMDPNGRLLPAPNRFPTVGANKSFKALGDALHAKGLKFGLHLLRGIPRQAVERNVPIVGTSYHAADIADKESLCRWNSDMYGVNMSNPGAQEYYDSVFALMASWDLDLVKVDDLSIPYHKAEIEAIRKAIDKCGRPIIFSTSPGATPVSEGEHIESHANMWRISDDFWDDYLALYEQFDRLNAWTPYRGSGHFPDADMLPLCNIRTWREDDHQTHFSQDEQLTMMTLWCIARSPLILGANLPNNDAFTLSLLTNDEVLAVDQKSLNNRQAYRKGNVIVWVADVPDSKDKYVAVFNTAPTPHPKKRWPATTTQPVTAPLVIEPAATQPAVLSVSLADIGISGTCSVHNLWTYQNVSTVQGTLKSTVNSHGAVLYRISPVK